MIDLPWFKKDKVDIDLNKALKILEEDHFGLEKLTSVNKKISTETINNIKQLKDPSKIADNII